MKILLFANTSWNLYNFRRGLISQLIENKHTVYALCNDDRYSQLLKKDNVNIIDFKVSQKGKNLFREFITIFHLFLIIKKLKPKYILSFTIKPNLYSLIISIFFNVKIINNITGLGNTFINKNFLTYLVIMLYKILLKRSHYILFQNNDDQIYFEKKYLIVNKKYDVIPGSGINIKKFNQIKKTFSDKNKLKFIFCGRTIKEKGIYEYCKASQMICKKNDYIEFYVLGFNNYEHLQEYKHIKFLNSNNYNKQMFINFDCVILPSYREGLPRVLLEFGLMGVPSITTNVPGCRSIVKDNHNGFLCEPKSTKSLYDSICNFINLSLTSRIKMSYNANQYVINNFDENIVISKYLSIIN